jgi:hypothetical protein
METAEQVLDGIATNIREVIRLMTIDILNKAVCIEKIERYKSHLSNLRGVAADDRIAAVDLNLNKLLDQLHLEAEPADDTAVCDSETAGSSFRAPRLFTGNTNFLSYVCVAF